MVYMSEVFPIKVCFLLIRAYLSCNGRGMGLVRTHSITLKGSTKREGHTRCMTILEKLFHLLFGVHYQLESATPGGHGHGGEISLYYLENITRQNLPLPGVGVMETTILCIRSCKAWYYAVGGDVA
jgi:hypothetical protein